MQSFARKHLQFGGTVPRHPAESKLKGISNTPTSPRDIPASCVNLKVPEVWKDQDEYLLHLSNRHGLKFKRGRGSERLYSRDELYDARMECSETCGSKRRVIVTEPVKPAPKAPRRRSKKPSLVPIDKQLAEALSTKGLVSSRLIGNRYVESRGASDVNNLMTSLRKLGLQDEGRCGRIYLYNPHCVDALCRRLGKKVHRQDSVWDNALATAPRPAT